MIYDSLENLALYNGVLPQIKEIVRMFRENAVDFTPGSHTTEVEGLRYNVVVFKTGKEGKEFEIHKKEADVQIMISGSEYILSAFRDYDESTLSYNEERDISMLEAKEKSRVLLSDHTFAIYLPGEPHKPGIAVGKSVEALKVVFKVRV